MRAANPTNPGRIVAHLYPYRGLGPHDRPQSLGGALGGGLRLSATAVCEDLRVEPRACRPADLIGVDASPLAVTQLQELNGRAWIEADCRDLAAASPAAVETRDLGAIGQG